MVFFSAFILGLLGSLHCVGMCGGLQMVLNKPQVIRTPTENQRHLLAINLGRITLYSLAGAGFGFMGEALGSQLNVPGWSVILRQLMALLMIVIGLQLIIFQQEKPLAFPERAGYQLWQHIQPLLNGSASSTYHQSFRRGLLWGFLPCGLVYSLLAVATVSGSAQNGLLTMLGFGAGTLPAMLLTGVLLWKFKQVLQGRWVRYGSGAFFVLVGLLMLTPTLLHHQPHAEHNPDHVQTSHSAHSLHSPAQE